MNFIEGVAEKYHASQRTKAVNRAVTALDLSNGISSIPITAKNEAYTREIRSYLTFFHDIDERLSLAIDKPQEVFDGRFKERLDTDNLAMTAKKEHWLNFDRIRREKPPRSTYVLSLGHTTSDNIPRTVRHLSQLIMHHWNNHADQHSQITTNPAETWIYEKYNSHHKLRIGVFWELHLDVRGDEVQTYLQPVELPHYSTDFRDRFIQEHVSSSLDPEEVEKHFIEDAHASPMRLEGNPHYFNASATGGVSHIEELLRQGGWETLTDSEELSVFFDAIRQGATIFSHTRSRVFIYVTKHASTEISVHFAGSRQIREQIQRRFWDHTIDTALFSAIDALVENALTEHDQEIELSPNIIVQKALSLLDEDMEEKYFGNMRRQLTISAITALIEKFKNHPTCSWVAERLQLLDEATRIDNLPSGVIFDFGTQPENISLRVPVDMLRDTKGR